ncbi:MAG: MoaD/ThiS family protein [archaeon GB-1867-005]|nr:MoaD/ThiS family protein [Candidatus Culexmicrobium cathedralense]
MRVTVEFYATLREKFGRKVELELNFDNPAPLITVLSQIDGLLEEIAENGRIKTMYKVLLNGLNVEFIKGLDTPVKDGDEICIFPPAGGG